PVHRPVDPRAERILALADERGVSGRNVARARALRDAVAELWDKPLPMNVAMAIAAVLLDLGYTVDAVKAVPILARTAGRPAPPPGARGPPRCAYPTRPGARAAAGR